MGDHASTPMDVLLSALRPRVLKSLLQLASLCNCIPKELFLSGPPSKTARAKLLAEESLSDAVSLENKYRIQQKQEEILFLLTVSRNLTKHFTVVWQSLGIPLWWALPWPCDLPAETCTLTAHFHGRCDIHGNIYIYIYIYIYTPMYMCIYICIYIYIWQYGSSDVQREHLSEPPVGSQRLPERLIFVLLYH